MRTPHHEANSPAVTATQGVAPARVARQHLAFLAILVVLTLVGWGLAS